MNFFLLKNEMNNKILESSDVQMNNNEKPKAEIIGADGNVFNLIGICSKALKRAGYREQADEMTHRVMSSKSYDDALSIMTEYVDPVNVDYDEYDDVDINI